MADKFKDWIAWGKTKEIALENAIKYFYGTKLIIQENGEVHNDKGHIKHKNQSLHYAIKGTKNIKHLIYWKHETE